MHQSTASTHLVHHVWNKASRCDCFIALRLRDIAMRPFPSRDASRNRRICEPGSLTGHHVGAHNAAAHMANSKRIVATSPTCHDARGERSGEPLVNSAEPWQMLNVSMSMVFNGNCGTKPEKKGTGRNQNITYTSDTVTHGRPCCA